jgi:Putative Flp pilus-assembly TadE/G-like
LNAVVQQIPEERGATLVIFALWLPVLALMATFVLDVGNWFEHKRHLQMQADAGALAAGGQFNSCFGGGAGSTTVSNAARQYGGDPSYAGGTTYNAQIGGTNKGAVSLLINSKTYPDPRSGDPGPDDTVEQPPCTAKMVDVKLTESNLPLFFGLFKSACGLFVCRIHSHARVQAFAETTRNGTLPVAVPDPGLVTAAAVDYLNEDTGAVLATKALTRVTGSNPPQWTNSGDPAAVDMAGVSHLGIRVKLSGATPAPATITCGQPLNQCYDLGTADATGLPSNGVLFVHGYPAAGYTTGAAGEPKVRGVTLFTGGGTPCSDPYFFSIVSGTCGLGVQADVAFPAVSSKNTVCATITGAFGYTETNQLRNTSGNTWATTGSGQFKFFGPDAQEGPLSVTLSWGNNGGGGNACINGTWNGYVFQRSFAATDPRSGPISGAWLKESPSGASSTYSYQNDGAGTTHSLWVGLQLQPALTDAIGVASPPVYLRVLGSQNQSIDCDPGYPNIRTELANGCRPTYTINTSGSCPTYNALWGTPQPWSCVKTQTGGSVGQVTQGMEDRLMPGGVCAPNNWSSFPNLSPSDPRLIPVILTPFGSFGGSGNDIVPVTGFSEFYITGWAKNSGSAKAQPDCPGDDAPPDKGYIVGHFVKYIDTLNSGGGGTSSCDFNAFGNCVAVLTK